MSQLFQVSARDHGALILMTTLAEHFGGETFVSLQEVADRMQLSQGYLEEIAAALKKANLIIGKQGPNGGYRLAKKPEAISLEDILTALEGPIALVDCHGAHTACPVAAKCSSKNVWKVLQQTIQKTLRETTLAEAV